VVLCVTPIATLACRSPVISAQPKLAQPKPMIANWEGKYNFIEQVEDDGPTMYMNYDLRISLARCGWRSFLTVNGHLTALDLQTDVRAIDANTIGLYYQQDIVPTLQTPQFQPGQLLLRIRREIPAPSKSRRKSPKPMVYDQPEVIAPIYRVYFEALTPLIPSHQTSGLEIAPPQSIHK
jgi:Family of unknown function (DUF5991)